MPLDEKLNEIMYIPKIIHRVWMVWNPNKPNIPEVYKEFDVVLKNLHPDWQFMEWNDKTILSFVRDFYPEFLPTYLAYDEPVKRHDACRYLLMDHFGGVFIQHSIKFQKNIEPLLQGAHLVVSENTKAGWTLSNGFIASVPHHDFWKIWINILPSRASLHTLDATGPHLLASVVHQYISHQADHHPITILNHKYLLPFDWTGLNNPTIKAVCIEDTSKCFELFPDAYSFCLWTYAWKDRADNTAKIDILALDQDEFVPLLGASNDN